MRRSLSRGEKRLVVCSVLILGIVGVSWLRTDLEAEPDWSVPDPSPTPNPNGFDLYFKAAATIIPANPPVDPVEEMSQVTGPKISPTQYSLVRRTAWLKQNARVWTLFEQAKAADSLQVQERGKRTMPFPNYEKLRKLARYKVTAVNTAKMRGNWSDAAKNGLDIIEMGGDITLGASLIGAIAGIRIEGIGEDTFRDTLAHLDKKETNEAARRLERLRARRPTLADVLREQKYDGMNLLNEVMQTAAWRRPSTWQLTSEGSSLKEQIENQFTPKRDIVASYKRSMDWYIALAQQPYDPSPGSPPEAEHFFNRLLLPVYGRAQFSMAQTNTKLALLQMRFALRSYLLEKGKYPATLEELVPNYTANIPLDPFGRGTPLHYQRKGDSYVLWSVGPDGTDDRGKPIPPLGTQKIAMTEEDSIGDAIALPIQ